MLSNLNIFQNKIHFPKQWTLFQGIKYIRLQSHTLIFIVPFYCCTSFFFFSLQKFSFLLIFQFSLSSPSRHLLVSFVVFLGPLSFPCYTCALSALIDSSLWNAIHRQLCQVPLLRSFPHHWEREAVHSKILKCLRNLSNPK